MTRESLTVEKRNAEGKSPVARRMRKTGRVPGVMYGAGGAVSFSADALDAAAIRRHGATLIDLDIEGSKHLTVLKEFQLHPMRGDIQHVDLQEVRMDQKVRTVAQIELSGESPGVKAGGVLTQGARELSIECTPANIPDSIVVDVSRIGLGQTLILRDVPAPDGVSFTDDHGMMVIAISVPRGAKGARKGAAADGDAAAEG
jgi:large subunit ribosomal protein L25